MPLNRKRRSQSQSSSDESDIKKIKDEFTELDILDETPNGDNYDHDFKDIIPRVSSANNNAKKLDKKPKKSEVIVLDCKKLDSVEMLLMFNSLANRWVGLPMPDIPGCLKDQREEYEKCFCAKNIIGFMGANIVFWKDYDTLVTLNCTSYQVKTIPSMTMGGRKSTGTQPRSTWKYCCALNRLIAINISSRQQTSANSSAHDQNSMKSEQYEESLYENAVVNIMTYDFREGGWEKRAEHHFRKRKQSRPHILYVENKDGLYLCISDQMLNVNNNEINKHGIHLLFIENYSWGLEEIECSEVSSAFCESEHLLSMGIDDNGNLSIIARPYIYIYDTFTGDWNCQICSEPRCTDSILANTIAVQGLRKFYFKIEEDQCDFCADNLESGATDELEIPPLYIYKKSLPKTDSLPYRTSSKRITNTAAVGKLTAFLVADSVMKQLSLAAWNKFECEF